MKKWIGYALPILFIIGLFSILGATRDCNEGLPFAQLSLRCKLRPLTAISCLLGYCFAFAWIGGSVAKAKGYRFIVGFLLGLFLNFMGVIVVAATPDAGTPRHVPRSRLVLALILFAVILLLAVLSARRGGSLF